MKGLWLWLLLLLAGLNIPMARGESQDAWLTQLQPRGYISDFAGVFSSQQIVQAEAWLQTVESNTTAEIAVVTLPSLQGNDINSVANQLFVQWGIGKKKKDNGALILTAVEDRKIRIEVGYGLESFITDARTGRILDENVVPYFKEGQMADGLMEGARALAALIQQEQGGATTNSAAGNPAQPLSAGGLLVVVIFFTLFIGIIILAARKGKLSGSGGSSGHSSSSSSSGSSSRGFGGGSSGGGGANRSW